MEKEYINPFGQRVVNCEIGYKVYDAEQKDMVLYRVGDDYVKKDGTKVYVFKDRDAYEKGKTASSPLETEPCFISNGSMVGYEAGMKNIASDDSLDDDTKHRAILTLTDRVGIRYRDIALSVGEKNADKMFDEIEERF